MGCIRIWKQKNGIEIDEVPYDYDYHAFEVCVDNRHVVTIYPDTLEDTEVIRARLNAGEDVRDWEDGNGHCVGTLITQRTTGLRETLKRIEAHAHAVTSDGVCYSDRLSNGADGTIWVDEVNGVRYEYETNDIDLLVDDMTDEDLKDVVIRGL